MRGRKRLSKRRQNSIRPTTFVLGQQQHIVEIRSAVSETHSTIHTGSPITMRLFHTYRANKIYESLQLKSVSYTTETFWIGFRDLRKCTQGFATS